MKRFVALFLVAVVWVTALSSCKIKLFDPVGEETEDTTVFQTQELEGNYDANGDVNLTSSENRKVYAWGSGYVAFGFLGETVQTITRIYEFEDAEKAQNYVNDAVQSAIADGQQPPNLIVKGKYALETVGFSAEKGTLGSYYASSRTEVEAAFGTDDSESGN